MFIFIGFFVNTWLLISVVIYFKILHKFHIKLKNTLQNLNKFINNEIVENVNNHVKRYLVGKFWHSIAIGI